jgi:Holliday junction resolvase RusA-like endonuclease
MTKDEDGNPWPLLDENNRPQLRIYTPKYNATEWKEHIKKTVAARVTPFLESGPVRVSWIAFFPRPKYMNTKKFADGPVRHLKKPDRDNIDKTVLDALSGIVCKDDSQICSGEFIEMFICAKPGLGWGDLERPHLLLKIEWITEEENINELLSDHGYNPPQGPTQEPGALPFGP